jgi:hypothetical protein
MNQQGLLKQRPVALLIFLVVLLVGCGKSDPPAPPESGSAPNPHPVKNVESLPSGAIREGARTMNKGADMGSTLEQQKQERDKDIEAETR